MLINTTQIATHIIDILIAAGAAFLLSMALTPVYTHFAFRFRAWKRIRDTAVTGEKAPVFHKLHAAKHKRNIPTMAGVVMIVTVAAVTLLLNYSRAQTLLPLAAFTAAGLVGLLDDFINIRGGNLGVAGLRSRIKFLLILAIATIGAFYFFYKLGYSSLHIPFLGLLEIGWLLIPFFIFVVVATANAVNITDGLDGLSGGLLAMSFSAYTIIAFFQENFGIAAFSATLVGTVLAYTWFNIHPARFFMGDSGSFALGTALGVIAMLTDTMLLLPVIGGMFVIEAGSSLVQISSKKLRHKKIFLSAPIHHHFEALGWPETKVTMRFWVLGSIFAGLGLVLAVLGGSL